MATNPFDQYRPTSEWTPILMPIDLGEGYHTEKETGFVECPVCSVTVLPACADRHLEWHESLRMNFQVLERRGG